MVVTHEREAVSEGSRFEAADMIRSLVGALGETQKESGHAHLEIEEMVALEAPVDAASAASHAQGVGVIVGYSLWELWLLLTVESIVALLPERPAPVLAWVYVTVAPAAAPIVPTTEAPSPATGSLAAAAPSTMLQTQELRPQAHVQRAGRPQE